jgi:hypothetical protein
LNLNALPSDGRELRMIRAAAAPTAAFAGLLLAAVVGSGPAGADSAGSGSTNDPKLVKPGSDLATAVSEIQGNSGLAPTVTGMITGLAIQLECPAFMTSLANGKLPEALQQAGNKPDSPMPQLPSLLPSPAIPKASPNK